MNRVSRYRTSIKKFIDSRSCISSLNHTPLENVLKDSISGSDFIFPILLLTILNSQNKENNVSFQGYYAATAIELLRIMMNIVNDPDEYNKEINKKLALNLALLANKSISQNIDVIKRHLSASKVIESQSFLINLVAENMGINGGVSDVLITSDTKIKNDVKHYYYKDKIKLMSKIKTLKIIDEQSLHDLIENRICKLSQLSIITAWILGCGNKDKINDLYKVGKYFGYMYTIANDFKNIDKDVMDAKEITNNYIINCGFQNAFEVFMDNKNRLIESLITLDIYTGTIKEIISLLESYVDNIVQNTSPDMSSEYSTIN